MSEIPLRIFLHVVTGTDSTSIPVDKAKLFRTLIAPLFAEKDPYQEGFFFSDKTYPNGTIIAHVPDNPDSRWRAATPLEVFEVRKQHGR